MKSGATFILRGKMVSISLKGFSFMQELLKDLKELVISIILVFMCHNGKAQTKLYTVSVEIQSGLNAQWNQINVPHDFVVNSPLNLSLSANSILYRRDYEKYGLLLGFSHMKYFPGYGIKVPNAIFSVGQSGSGNTFYVLSGIGKSYKYGKFSIRPEVVFGLGYLADGLMSKKHPGLILSNGGQMQGFTNGDTAYYIEETSYFDHILHFTASLSSQFSFDLGKGFDFCLTPYFTRGFNTYERMELDYFFQDANGQRKEGEGTIKFRGTQFGLRLGLTYHIPYGIDFNRKELKKNTWDLEASYLFWGSLFEQITDPSGRHYSSFSHSFFNNWYLAFVVNKGKYYRTYGIESSQFWLGKMESEVEGNIIQPLWNMSKNVYLSSGIGRRYSYKNFHLNPSIRLAVGLGFESLSVNNPINGMPNAIASSDNYEFQAYYNNPPIHIRTAARLGFEYSFFKNFYVSVFPEFIHGINQRAKIDVSYEYSTGETGTLQNRSRGSMFGYGFSMGWHMK